MWTHGTIEDKGNHNHHNRSYKICITKTGRIITCNRWHIKTTNICAEHYLHSQLNKHTKTDPLNTIMDYLNKNPHPSTIADTTSERPHNHCTANNWTAPDNAQNYSKKQMEEKDTDITTKVKDSNNKEEIIRTRYGRIVRKLDRLNYYKNITDTLADMLALQHRCWPPDCIIKIRGFLSQHSWSTYYWLICTNVLSSLPVHHSLKSTYQTTVIHYIHTTNLLNFRSNWYNYIHFNN